jgi:TetR/AcrR family transcriptional regulator, ethionamide resistance regulator
MSTTTVTLPPARRRGPRKGDLKEQAILDTAHRLLGERPFEEIGIDELASGAGISRPTFYFYFKSKTAVVRALLEQITGEAYASAEWLSRSDKPPAETIRRSIAAGAELWREHGAVLRAAVQVPELHGLWEELIAGFIEASADRVRQERRAGVAPEGGPSARALATALIWMNERCFYTASLGIDASLRERDLVNTLTAIWLRTVYGSDEPGAVPTPPR